MKSKKQRLNEIEEIMSEENIGLNGWLFFVQVAMIIQIVFCLGGILYFDGYLIAFAIPLILASAALVSFYKQNKSFRLLFVAATVALVIDGFFIVTPVGIANKGLYNVMLLIHLAPFIAACICLFFSKRFKATFCETGKEMELERRKNLVGTNGWLLFVLLQLFVMLPDLFILLLRTIIAFSRDKIILTAIKASSITYLVLIPIALAAVVICISLLRKRKQAFRFVYIACVVLYTPIKLLSIQSSYLMLFVIIWIVVQGIIIFALFNSYRVKNTFK